MSKNPFTEQKVIITECEAGAFYFISIDCLALTIETVASTCEMKDGVQNQVPRVPRGKKDF